MISPKNVFWPGDRDPGYIAFTDEAGVAHANTDLKNIQLAIEALATAIHEAARAPAFSFPPGYDARTR